MILVDTSVIIGFLKGDEDSLPSWLNERAEKAGVNFSQVLQEGLKTRLGIKQP